MPWQPARCGLSERNSYTGCKIKFSGMWHCRAVRHASPAVNNVLSPAPRSEKANAPQPGLVPFFKVAEDCEADFSILDDSQWSASNCIIL